MNAALVQFLVAWQYWWLTGLFAIALVTTWLELPRLRVPRPVLLGALLLGVLASTLTAWVAPRTNRIFYDEHIYQGIGRVMSDLHRAEICNDGSVEYGRLQCVSGEYNKEPYGYPYLLSVVYSLAGVSDSAAPRFNNLVAGLVVAVVVLLTYVLFYSTPGALLGGTLMAGLPMQLTWSNSAAAEPVSALFCAVSILAAAHFSRRRTTSALAWAVAVSALTITMRPECLLILPLVALAILLLAPGEYRTARLWWSAAAGAGLVLLPLLHAWAVRNESWGTTTSRFSWEHAVANAPVNVQFYFGDERFPVLVTLAALTAAFALGRWRERLLLAAYFLTFWTVFLFFYAGSYNYGADVRYSLMTYAPLAVLGGGGLGHLVTRLVLRGRGRWSERTVATAFACAVAFQCLWYLPVVRAVGEEAWAARADVTYARRFAAALPPHSFVLTNNPAMFHLWGVSAAQLWLAKHDAAYLENRLFQRYRGGVYLHWNFWCNTEDPVRVQDCRDVLDRFPHEVVTMARERHYEYALYRLTMPEGVTAPGQ